MNGADLSDVLICEGPGAGGFFARLLAARAEGAVNTWSGRTAADKPPGMGSRRVLQKPPVAGPPMTFFDLPPNFFVVVGLTLQTEFSAAKNSQGKPRTPSCANVRPLNLIYPIDRLVPFL
jgi:hypothetical protein